jgi:hypothetical protein
MKRSLVLALCLLSSSAYAQSQKLQVTPLKTHITAQSCISTVDAASRTATIDVGAIGPTGTAMPLAVIGVELTWGAATAVTMTCTHSPDSGTTAYKIQECPVAAGVATCVNASHSKAVSASVNWANRVDTTGFLRLSCVFLCDGVGADTITVKSYQTTK